MYVKVSNATKAGSFKLPIGECGIVTSGPRNGCVVFHGYDQGRHVWVVLHDDSTHTTIGAPDFTTRALAPGESILIRAKP
jgi:hypothetical protein